ncbi:MAG: uracil-DNA glycosylase [Actinomycetaceae bacterium]|nr:uracil-DNA glycosylase [Actinomycetaceae bacterium]
MSDAPKPLEELLDPGWATALRPVEGQIRVLGDMLRAEIAAGRGYFPPGSAVLRAFTYPFDEVKVLLVGQDPYPTPGHAMGLSFSVSPGVNPPRSLVNIYHELHDDLGVSMPSSGDLIPWAKQGVCLLNRVLTVQPGMAASHRGKGWEEVTQCAIEALVARNKPLVAILWGNDARSLAPMLGETPRIESVHPSPLSAARGFFGSKPFSRANELLMQQGATPVEWALP